MQPHREGTTDPSGAPHCPPPRTVRKPTDVVQTSQPPWHGAGKKRHMSSGKGHLEFKYFQVLYQGSLPQMITDLPVSKGKLAISL